MNANTTNEINVTSPSPKQEIDWWEVTRKGWASRKLILMACGMGAVIGLSTPKEYWQKYLLLPKTPTEAPLRVWVHSPLWQASTETLRLSKMPSIRRSIRLSSSPLLLHPNVPESTVVEHPDVGTRSADRLDVLSTQRKAERRREESKN